MSCNCNKNPNDIDKIKMEIRELKEILNIQGITTWFVDYKPRPFVSDFYALADKLGYEFKDTLPDREPVKKVGK